MSDKKIMILKVGVLELRNDAKHPIANHIHKLPAPYGNDIRLIDAVILRQLELNAPSKLRPTTAYIVNTPLGYPLTTLQVSEGNVPAIEAVCLNFSREGQDVDCYGEWKEDSNAALVANHRPTGEEMDNIWCGDGWPDGPPPKNWGEVVDHMIAWANRQDIELMELTAC